MDNCPNCPGKKSTTARLCKTCAAIAQIGKPRGVVRRVPMQARAMPCPYCDAPFRACRWHDQEFWHCTGCGLETTPDEIKRFAIEEKMEAA